MFLYFIPYAVSSVLLFCGGRLTLRLTLLYLEFCYNIHYALSAPTGR